MCKIYYHDIKSPLDMPGEDLTLIRKPVDMTSGKEYEKCRYAFFPDRQLCADEPEIAVKAYDSILFQYPDTGFFMQDITSDEIPAQWEALGRPEIIVTSLRYADILKKKFPQIPAVSIYELLQKLQISGGCNSTDYALFYPETENAFDGAKAAVRELAESMGVKLHDAGEKSFPYITCCMDCRDSLKNSGKDAVHILELIYGMGASNTHMIHEHDHDHDHDNDHDNSETCGHGKSSTECSVCGDSPDCSGVCSDCDADCENAPGASASANTEPPASLPTDEEQLANLRELKEVMLQLFWS